MTQAEDGVVTEPRQVVLPETDADPVALRRVYAAVPSSIAVLAAVDRGLPLAQGIGMTVATLLPVSLDPPCLGAMVQAGSATWSRLATAETIGVSVLADHQAWIGRRVATGAPDARFSGVPALRTARGTGLLIEGAAAWFETRLAEQTVAGDHVFVLLRVAAAQAVAHREPVVFHRSLFRSLREGDAEPGAWMWELGDAWQ